MTDQQIADQQIADSLSEAQSFALRFAVNEESRYAVNLTTLLEMDAMGLLEISVVFGSHFYGEYGKVDALPTPLGLRVAEIVKKGMVG